MSKAKRIGKLPTWWKWHGDPLAQPLGSVFQVWRPVPGDELEEACVQQMGDARWAWAFRRGPAHSKAGGFEGTEAEAKRACERAYMALAESKRRRGR